MTVESIQPHITAILGLESNINEKTNLVTITSEQLQTTNYYFEYLDDSKKTRPFLDIDTCSNYKPKDEETFNQTVLNIEKKIINEFPELALLNASHYKCEKWIWDRKQKKHVLNKITPKISFRLTDHTIYCDNLYECKLYCMNEFKSKLQKALGSDFDILDIDSKVYRKGGGKMSCVNSYKHTQQSSRIRQLVNGDIEDTFIQFINGTETRVQSKQYEESKSKPKPKPKPKEKSKPKEKIVIKTTMNKTISVDKPNQEIIQKFWDYANIINKSELKDREKWIDFTFIHVNIIGISDYDSYDNFCKTIENYDSLANKMKYEELYDKKDSTNIKLGWKRLYELAYSNNKDEKIKLDQIYMQPFNIWNMLKMKTEVNQIDYSQQILDLEKNEELKPSVIKKQMKELKNKQKDDTQKYIDECYKKMKPYFELYHFKLIKPFNYCKITDDYDVLEFYSKKKFQDLNDNIEIVKHNTDFTYLWFKDPQIKTYDKIDFIPYGTNCPKSTFNLFNGFRIEKIRTQEKHSFEHILEALKLNAGDNDDMFNYLLKYSAHLVQKPAILPRTAIVIMGEQGTGKSSYWENFGNKILDDRYTLQSSKSDDIVGKFNVNKNKILVIMEETEGKNTFLNNSQIKTLITQDTKWWEGKGKDAILVNNCSRMIFISNNRTPVKIELSDRRFVVSESSNRHIQDEQFFGKVMEEWNDDIAVKNFYNYLMNIDISDFSPSRDRVITEAYKDLQSVSIPTIARFLECKYYDYEEFDNPISSTSFFTIYKKWMIYRGFNIDLINITTFGRDLKKYEGIEKKRTNCGIMYYLTWDKIYAYLKKKGFVEECAENWI